MIGNEIGVKLGSGGCPDALCEDEILVSNGDSVERSAVEAVREFGVHFRRSLLGGGASDCDEGVELGIELVDLIETVACKFKR